MFMTFNSMTVPNLNLNMLYLIKLGFSSLSHYPGSGLRLIMLSPWFDCSNDVQLGLECKHNGV